MTSFILPPENLFFKENESVSEWQMSLQHIMANDAVNLECVARISKTHERSSDFKDFPGTHETDFEAVKEGTDYYELPSISFYGPSDKFIASWVFCGPEYTLAEWSTIRDAVALAIVDGSFLRKTKLDQYLYPAIGTKGIS